jgi:thiol-disulfide isomerase/thioredoxin
MKKQYLNLVFAALMAVSCGSNKQVAKDAKQEVKLPEQQANIPAKNVSEQKSTIKRDSNVFVYPGDVVPKFEVLDKQGKKVGNNVIKGNYALLMFFATWCGHCQHELPEVQALYDKYGNRKDFKFVLMNQKETLQDVEAFFNSNGYTMPFYLDTAGEALHKFAKGGVPRMLLVDKQGVVIESTVGYSKNEVTGKSTFDVIRNRVEQIFR